ncbi:pathogenesis-related thaumatin-like protein 3.5 [Euphorbia lathyris]|uniref:pathogenesis-related thaumatin-like protein 3.5 n=1 Tax=Euphorbia lathyris TaxID=212925 RepID=UPI0033133089
MPQNLTTLAFFCIFIALATGQNSSSSGKTFTLYNNCKDTIWPAILTKGNDTDGYGFPLKPGQSAFYNATTSWSGRIWARTGCNFNKDGTGSCETGSCGASLNCSEPSSPPNTIAEFTLGDIDFFDVSLVDGFNVPIAVSPLNTKGKNCSIAGCDGDLRQNCPSELSVTSNNTGKVIACRSTCDVFNTDELCCRGTYGDPVACVASNYSRSFKQVCPAASSYAYDTDATSIITCAASDYIVSFCASRNQTFCSYHDNKIVCNTSYSGSEAVIPQGWWILMVTLPLALFLHINI